MSEWIAAIILGIIEGLTEFIPVSSTGHLLLAEHLRWIPRQTDLFNIVIQCGAVLAVLPLFRNRLFNLLLDWREKRNQKFALKIALSFLITAVGGLILDKHGYKLAERLQPVAWALLIGGIVFVAYEILARARSTKVEITWMVAIAVGIGQLIAAIFPGASRSGSTILLALILGMARPAATEFSFLVGIPTILAASGWKILHALRHHEISSPQENWGMILLASAVAAVVSFVAVKWMLRYVQTHTFAAFGWYRIALGGLILILLAAG